MRVRLTAALLVMAMEPATAAEWTYSDGLLLGTAFTDNVDLTENDKESAWSAVVTPNLLLNGKGARMSVQLAAALQFVTNSDEHFYPQIRGSVNGELIQDRFFVNAYASADQETIDPLRPAGSPINSTGNLTTTYTLGINPYWVEHFSNIADLRLDYDHRWETHSGGRNEPDDRRYDDFYFSLASGRHFNILEWGLTGSYSHTAYSGDSGSNTTFKSLNARIGYILTRHLKPYATFGREWNTYDTSRSRSGGDMWLVGAVWTPNPRVYLDAGWGHRFFGDTPKVTFRYRHRRSTIRLGYTRNIESGYQSLDEQQILATTNLAGNPVNPFAGPPGAVISARGFNSFIGNGAYVDDRFTGGYLLQGRRTSFGIDARYSDKVYEKTPQEILEWEVGLTLSRQLARQLSVDARTSWYRTEDQGDFQADTWHLRLGVTRQLGLYTHLRFSYSHEQRDSNRPNDDYTENRLALTLNTSLSKLVKHADF